MADRSHSAGMFTVQIGDSHVAFVKKFDGLSIEADIASHDHGPELFQTKNVTNMKWTPGKLTVGIGMGKGLYTWMKQSFDKQCDPKGQNGSVIYADFKGQAQEETTFMGAHISSIALPKLAGDSKDAAYFDVEFEAEQVRWAAGDNGVVKANYGTKQKAWLCSNFRFKMGDLPCENVSSVDAMTWKCAVIPDQIGTNREPTKHSAKVTVPDCKVSVSMKDYNPWAKAARKWFVDGEHLAGHHMQGQIDLLDPNMKKVLGTIELHDCGFKKFTKQPVEANKESIARFDVEFYIERMSFTINESDA